MSDTYAKGVVVAEDVVVELEGAGGWVKKRTRLVSVEVDLE